MSAKRNPKVKVRLKAPGKQHGSLHGYARPRPEANPVPTGVYDQMVAAGLAERRVSPDGRVKIVLTPEGKENLKRLESHQKPDTLGRKFIDALGPYVK